MSILSDKIKVIAVNYLGPAAEKFLQRQTSAHMGGIAYSDITSANLSELVKWIRISSSLLIGADKGKEFADKVSSLQ